MGQIIPFPVQRAVPIGEGCAGWYESEIDAFVANPVSCKA